MFCNLQPTFSLAGMSRSVTVAVAYIMSVTKLGMNEAIRAVRGARPVANPNEGFQRQLQDFEFIRLKDVNITSNHDYTVAHRCSS